jgi:hypothetical protein
MGSILSCWPVLQQNKHSQASANDAVSDGMCLSETYMHKVVRNSVLIRKALIGGVAVFVKLCGEKGAGSHEYKSRLYREIRITGTPGPGRHGRGLESL